MDLREQEKKELHKLVDQHEILQAREQTVAKELKTTQTLIKDLVETEIPAQLKQMGLKTATLHDGTEIELSSMYFANIKKSNEIGAFRWLRENGFGYLIKRNLSITFGRGDDTDASEIKTNLEDQGWYVNDKESLHYQTLQGFVREQIKEGTNIPRELFGVYQRNEAKITRSKE